VDHVLPGLSAPTPRLRPVGAAPCGVLSLGLAALPIRPIWLWLLLVVATNAVPWLVGAFWRAGPRDRWRLSTAGLECRSPDGTPRTTYARRRIEEFVLTAEDDMLFVLHKFGGTEIGRLADMGFDRLSFFVTARRIGIPVHVLDGDQSVLEADDDAPPPGRGEHRRLLAQEAQLLKAAHERAERADPAPPTTLTAPARRDRRVVALGVVVALLGAGMALRLVLTATPGDPAAPEILVRVMAALWLVIAVAAVILTRAYWLRRVPLRWSVTVDEIAVRQPGIGDWRVPASEIASCAVGTGPVVEPGTGELAEGPLVLVFGHRLDLLARLPTRGIDGFELAHVLSEHGFPVITADQGRTRPTDPGYGLEGLPDVFKEVPGGRLVVDDGIGWADASGETVLRLPRERLGRLELLTVNGQAWLRLYDADGDEFFTAPLSALRTSRTALRDSARRAGLPVTDAEYDAYENAVLQRAFTAAGPAATDTPDADTDAGPDAGPGADPEAPAGAGAGAADGAAAGRRTGDGTGPATGTRTGASDGSYGEHYLLDISLLIRRLGYAFALVVGQIAAVVSAVLLRAELGGFAIAWLWSAAGGLAIAAIGAWRHDRDRPRLRVSTTAIAAIRRSGRTQWRLDREVIGGVGVDRSDEDGRPRLVVWNPAGRPVRQLPVGLDAAELRRACERCGLPWGPPGTGAAAPPPEL
jgi:hypothetical protein